MLRIGSLGRRFGTLNFKRFEDVKRIPSCSVRLFSTEEPTYTPPPVYSEEAEKIYKTKFESYRVWGNHLLLKEHGRFFDADKRILMEKESKMFPMVHALALDNSQVTFPDFVEADVRLVCVSFKGFGYESSKAWIEPFRVNFEGNNRVKVAQLFCHEYGFLKFLSSLFVQAAQKEVGANREGVAVKVGDVKVGLSQFLHVLCFCTLFSCC